MFLCHYYFPWILCYWYEKVEYVISYDVCWKKRTINRKVIQSIHQIRCKGMMMVYFSRWKSKKISLLFLSTGDSSGLLHSLHQDNFSDRWMARGMSKNIIFVFDLLLFCYLPFKMFCSQIRFHNCMVPTTFQLIQDHTFFNLILSLHRE